MLLRLLGLSVSSMRPVASTSGRYSSAAGSSFEATGRNDDGDCVMIILMTGCVACLAGVVGTA